VVGGGYTGVELAATLAERVGDRGKVQIVNVAPEICPSAPPGNRDAAYKVKSDFISTLFFAVSFSSRECFLFYSCFESSWF
jgi:NADH:ubiquinone reductase (non-electrogenic)